MQGGSDLKEDGLVLGRSKDCDLSVKDPTASRKHVKLTWTGETYSFLDMGSGNGTTINGTRQGAGDLGHGDILGLGQSNLRFDLEQVPVAASAPAQAPAAKTTERVPVTPKTPATPSSNSKESSRL